MAHDWLVAAHKRQRHAGFFSISDAVRSGRPSPGPIIFRSARFELNLEHFAHSEEGLALKVNPTAQAAPESQPAAPANTQVQYATVYTFVVWDHDRRATAIYPRMATREAIAKMRGKVNEETAWVVESSALDVEGFYSGSRQP